MNNNNNMVSSDIITDEKREINIPKQISDNPSSSLTDYSIVDRLGHCIWNILFFPQDVWLTWFKAP